MNNTKNVIIAVLVLVLAVLAIWFVVDRMGAEETAINDQNGSIQATPTPSPTPSLTPTPTVTPTPTPTPTTNPTVTPEAFANNNWLVESATVGGVKVDMSANVPQPLTLNFDKSKKAYAGFAGCNGFSGTYSASGADKFAFGASVSTKMFCQETSALEGKLFEAMGEIETFKISGGKLILTGDAGKAQITYIPAI